MRADAIASRQRILSAAATLAGDRGLGMAEIAAAAGVGRSTIYRHFPNRQALNQALEEVEAAAGAEESSRAQPRQGIGQVASLPFQSPGQLGRDRPLALEVTRVLDEVPPHLVPDQLVAEARRAAGVAVALYVVDIDGSHLLRLAGTQEFPDRIEDPPRSGRRSSRRDCPSSTNDSNSSSPAASPNRCGCAAGSSGCCSASVTRSAR